MKLAFPVNEGWLYNKDKYAVKLFASYDRDEDGSLTFGDRTMKIYGTRWAKEPARSAMNISQSLLLRYYARGRHAPLSVSGAGKRQAKRQRVLCGSNLSLLMNIK